MTIDPRCKCSHKASDHDAGFPSEPCNRRACGCVEFRLDPRAPLTADEAPREEAS